jgi:hypothetical protein
MLRSAGRESQEERPCRIPIRPDHPALQLVTGRRFVSAALEGGTHHTRRRVNDGEREIAKRSDACKDCVMMQHSHYAA